jgi:elongator complex protein 4
MSFRKFKTGSKQPARGTRISIINGKTLTSTGVASLDELVGGGCPMSSIMLIKTDRYTGYAHLLLKYFIAQGIAHQHSVSLSTRDMPPEELFEGLMAVVKGKSESTVGENDDDDKAGEEEYIPQLSGVTGLRPMGALRSGRPTGSTFQSKNDAMTIAWRYQRLPNFSTALSNEFRGPNSKYPVFILALPSLCVC